MKTKDYLLQLQRLDIAINQKLNELSKLRTIATGIGSIDYQSERVQKTPSGKAPFENVVYRMLDICDEISNEINEFIEKRHKIINQIQDLKNPKHIEILYRRYVEYKKLETIALEMNYTYQYVLELHGQALQAFQAAQKNL